MRTVQRDLKELKNIFPIEQNEKNPRDFGWRWPKGIHLDIPGMSVPEALAMRLVERHLKQLLPASMLKGLQGMFSLAQSKLNQVEENNNNHSKSWLNKVRVVPPAQPLLPPVVDEAVQDGVYQAVLENLQIKATYQSMSADQSKEYVLHPLGLVMRGPVTYLVASAWDYADARLYALHRFRKIDILDAAVSIPDGFNLDKALASGFADFTNQGEPIKLILRCTDSVAAYLAETPLAIDQKIEAELAGWVRLTATVNDTWQLNWWILGQANEVEVCAPENLREQVKNTLINTSKIYEFNV